MKLETGDCLNIFVKIVISVLRQNEIILCLVILTWFEKAQK